jgi:hypothetical protein
LVGYCCSLNHGSLGFAIVTVILRVGGGGVGKMAFALLNDEN